MMRWVMVAVLALWVGLWAVPAAHAEISLETAKQAGLVGERPDGLIGFVVGTVPADVRAMVEQVNAQRLQRYAQVAAGNGTSVSGVQAVAGRQLIERSPAGQYVMGAGGQWVRKQQVGRLFLSPPAPSCANLLWYVSSGPWWRTDSRKEFQPW
jgi:uncharacterized protein